MARAVLGATPSFVLDWARSGEDACALALALPLALVFPFPLPFVLENILPLPFPFPLPFEPFPFAFPLVLTKRSETSGERDNFRQILSETSIQ